jgi:hypothetical protein
MGQEYELGAADDAFCQVLKKREISISDSNNCSKIKGRFCCTKTRFQVQLWKEMKSGNFRLFFIWKMKEVLIFLLYLNRRSIKSFFKHNCKTQIFVTHSNVFAYCCKFLLFMVNVCFNKEIILQVNIPIEGVKMIKDVFLVFKTF